MENRNKQLIRIIRLMNKLKKWKTTKQLISKSGARTRTFYRDIDALKSLGIKIKRKEGKWKL